MTTPYPVDIEVTPPPRLERIQLLLRLAILVAIGLAGFSMGWLSSVLYLFLPVFAAVAISSMGGEKYLATVAPPLGRVLSWVVTFHAYMLLVLDRFPTSAESGALRMTLHPTGRQTAGGALLRWVASIPSALVLLLLALVSGVLFLIGAVSILATETQPTGIVQYQIGILRWQARLLAYHASLVEEYPPFSLQSGAHSDELPSAAH